MNNIYKKYQGKCVCDAGAYMSDEAKQLATYMKRRIRATAKTEGMELVDCYIGHYDISGFIKKDEKFVYFNWDIPRGNGIINFNRSDAFAGFLIRTAQHEKDYKGGQNNFSSLQNFFPTVKRLLGA